jgi:hypothetical protein
MYTIGPDILNIGSNRWERERAKQIADQELNFQHFMLPAVEDVSSSFLLTLSIILCGFNSSLQNFAEKTSVLRKEKITTKKSNS